MGTPTTAMPPWGNARDPLIRRHRGSDMTRKRIKDPFVLNLPDYDGPFQPMQIVITHRTDGYVVSYTHRGPLPLKTVFSTLPKARAAALRALLRWCKTQMEHHIDARIQLEKEILDIQAVIA